ncbi:MAG: hypothetical protein AUK32_02005 [Candidatus Aquicultor secundus]|uniref:FHA domain-containing protein n=1 Tax=Candidatus Aquicultor secundus TaxID=1973895 RepID=UPI0009101185|nr:FHA domain-containing protein [Candidatus Aquicultor secundus]NCO65093.1 FHA domain-containing protein [Solirubrobacter sp.]OIO88234.1 MAG: hypothetical protein AUK32_02005 [Candidatus Aquicultor secundus]
MFNELTLGLHVLLLASIYVFLFIAVKVISKDLAWAKGAATEKLPRIVIVEGAEPGAATDYPIDEQLIIGRSPDCDIILEDTFASAHHARVYPANSAYWLEDLKSTNGTTTNNKQINAPVRLKKGSTFRIGQSVFKFMD